MNSRTALALRWQRTQRSHMDLHQRVAAMGRAPTYSGLADSLPRRLQACMQELLSANERHHELLIASHSQEGQLEAAQAEVERLTQRLTVVESGAQRREGEITRERESSAALRDAYVLQQGRLEAAEAEVSRLQAALAASGHRGVLQSTEVAQLQHRASEADQRAELAERRGYSEGAAQQHAEDQGQLRRLQARPRLGFGAGYGSGPVGQLRRLQARPAARARPVTRL